jgi:hypothetical protein
MNLAKSPMIDNRSVIFKITTTSRCKNCKLPAVYLLNIYRRASGYWLPVAGLMFYIAVSIYLSDTLASELAATNHW